MVGKVNDLFFFPFGFCEFLVESFFSEHLQGRRGEEEERKGRGREERKGGRKGERKGERKGDEEEERGEDAIWLSCIWFSYGLVVVWFGLWFGLVCGLVWLVVVFVCGFWFWTKLRGRFDVLIIFKEINIKPSKNVFFNWKGGGGNKVLKCGCVVVMVVLVVLVIVVVVVSKLEEKKKKKKKEKKKKNSAKKGIRVPTAHLD